MSDYSGMTDQQLLAIVQSQGGSGPPQPAQPPAIPPPMPAVANAASPIGVTPAPGGALPSQPTPQQAALVNWSAAHPDLSHLSDAQLQAMISDANPGMSVGEDVARSGEAGLLRGSTGLLTAPADLMGMAQGLGDKVAHFARDHGLNMPSPNQGPPGIGTYLDAAAIALAKRMGLDPNAAQIGVGAFNPIAAFAGPHREEAATALNGGLPLHTPQTPVGAGAEHVAEFAPGALAPGSWWMRAGRVGLPAAGSSAGQAVAPEGYKDWGALLGAALGGGVEGAAEGIANAPHKLMAEALAGTTPESIQAGTDLQQRSAALPGGGIHVTAPEAIGSPSMLALQRFVKNSPLGGPLVEHIFAARPGQIRSTTQALADAIAPPDESAAASAQANQRAATSAINGVRQDINSGTNGHYANLNGVQIPEADYARLAANPSYAAALADVRGNPELSGLALGADNDLGTAMQVYQRLGEMETAATPGITNPSGSMKLAGVRGAAQDLADQIGRGLSPDWGAALDEQAARRQAELEPLKGGPVGAIANSKIGPNQLPSQVAALIPAKPPEGYANDAANAVNILPQSVTANLTRHYVVDALNDVGRDRTNGQPTQNFGGTLASQLVGHPERAQIFDTALGAVDPSGALQTHAKDLADALFATGRDPGAGSLTEFNGQIRQRLANAPALVKTISTALDPLEIGRHIDNAVGGALYRRNVESIAKILEMSPQDAGAALQNYKATGGVNPLVSALLIAGPKSGEKP